MKLSNIKYLDWARVAASCPRSEGNKKSNMYINPVRKKAPWEALQEVVVCHSQRSLEGLDSNGH